MFLVKQIVVIVILLAGLTAPTTAGEMPDFSAPEPTVMDGIEGVLAAFDAYPIVAIGEQHGIQELGAFYVALIQHPEFAQKVDAVVMEYGNALYQEVADRYVAGEDVPYSEVRQIWSDAIGRIPGGTEILYGQIYAAIREVNRGLPEAERIRVLLGDPPIDWSGVETREDLLPVQQQRETHFAGVVIEQVLERGLRGLVITGGPHLDRTATTMPELPTPDEGQTLAIPFAPTRLMQQIVEEAYPGRTWVVIVHTGFSDEGCNAAVEARMESWAAPTMAVVRGSWLEGLNCQKFPAAIMINPASGGGADQMMGAPSGVTLAAPVSQITQADAYLYVGKRDGLTMSPFALDIYLDAAYFNEQSRRHRILFGEPLDPTAVLRGNPRLYVDRFPAG